MSEKRKKKKAIGRALWIVCRYCGIEYLEEKESVKNDGYVECPNCGARLNLMEDA